MPPHGVGACPRARGAITIAVAPIADATIGALHHKIAPEKGTRGVCAESHIIYQYGTPQNGREILYGS
jgi:hypothetical protein